MAGPTGHGRVVCPECGRTIVSIRVVGAHVTTVAGHPCDRCRLRASTVAQLDCPKARKANAR